MNELLDELSAFPHANLEQRGDGIWMWVDLADMPDFAEKMLTMGARLSTVTGIAQGKETNLIYHYALGGQAINIRCQTMGNQCPSIAVKIPAANWIEREIYDLYGVEFKGHPNLERLVRPSEMPVGFYRQPGGKAAKAERRA